MVTTQNGYLLHIIVHTLMVHVQTNLLFLNLNIGVLQFKNTLNLHWTHQNTLFAVYDWAKKNGESCLEITAAIDSLVLRGLIGR